MRAAIGGDWSAVSGTERLTSVGSGRGCRGPPRLKCQMAQSPDLVPTASRTDCRGAAPLLPVSVRTGEKAQQQAESRARRRSYSGPGITVA